MLCYHTLSLKENETVLTQWLAVFFVSHVFPFPLYAWQAMCCVIYFYLSSIQYIKRTSFAGLRLGAKPTAGIALW